MFTKVLLTLAVLVAMFAAFPLPVSAGEAHDCEHMEHMSDLGHLRHCVEHHIDNPGIVKSLLAKVDAAQAAVDRGQSDVAVKILYALIQEVEAQAGKQISQEHAGHLTKHATAVIAALGQ